MRGHRRSTHSLIVLLIAMLGLALAAPAGVAAQDDDTDDEDTPPAIATQDDDANQDDADQDANTDTNDTDQDDPDAEPPGCDDGDWVVATTEDGTRFSSEDHCDDHVAEHGEDSLIEIGAYQVDAYVDVYVAVPYRGGGIRGCNVYATPVNGQVGQWVVVSFLASTGEVLEATIADGGFNTSASWFIPYGEFVQAGTAEVVLNPGDAPVGYIPIHMVNGNSVCREQSPPPS